MTCESCMVNFEPDTLFWGRWEGKKRLYNHVNYTDCKPKTCEKGKCGELNPVDSDDSDKRPRFRDKLLEEANTLSVGWVGAGFNIARGCAVLIELD
ncbi:expressed unknown protein [Ectocarpus siliculosus]|uniref:Uncharacterized protein n=1 Tax=Ectocarpus siliculosus TaxID=2880 RepID=D7G178_ECTSI|nr:expressed unknown protein [Ectocarpus siliculosus]|eukprot:CBJ33188.1 expressed unknown protein [Ectocarpus siliculosus]